MATRLLRWQGPARARACSARLAVLMSQWHGEWCAHGESPVATPRHDAPDEPGLGWRGASHGGASAWLATGLPDPAVLGATLVGEAQADSFGLAQRLAERAIADLLARLLSTTPDQLQWRDEPDADELAPRHGALCFELSGPLAGARLCIDARLCEALAPAAPASRDALSDLRMALAPETVTFDVAIPLGDMPLSESMSLGVGEVLLLGPLLQAEVQLLGASGRPVAGGTLARAGEGRAIRIDHTFIQQGNAQ